MKSMHAAALIAAAIGLAGWLGYRIAASAPAAAAPARAANPTDTLKYGPGAPQLSYLEIQPAAEAEAPTLEAQPGKIGFDEDHTVRVTSPVLGRVVELVAQPGAAVGAGDVLARLDSPDYAQALADARKADADLALKRKAASRAEVLVGAGAIAQKDAEGARADLGASAAESARAHAVLKNLDPGGKPGARYVLRAPIAGIVVDRSINPGQEVRPDAAVALFVITDPARLWATFELAERDVSKVRVGQAVAIETDAWPGQRFDGRVVYVGASLDPLSRRVTARAELDNADGKLRPEMFARVSPLAHGGARAVAVPNTALVSIGLHTYVFVEESPGTLKRREVQLSLAGTERSYVAAGLHPGERVVTRGAVLLNGELGEAE